MYSIVSKMVCELILIPDGVVQKMWNIVIILTKSARKTTRNINT